MKIRTKTFITVVFTILVLIWVLYATSATIIRSGFSEVENQTARQNVDRAAQNIWDRARNLSSTIRDWSFWDLSYEFIQDGNQTFIENNLVDNVFTSLDINVLIFLKPDGEILYARAYDFDNQLSLPISQDLRNHLRDNKALRQHRSANDIYKGLISLPQQRIMVASSPILNSQGKGEIMGTLIMGRYLDQRLVDSVSINQRLSVSLFDVNDPQLPKDFQDMRNKLVVTQQVNYEFSVLGGEDTKRPSALEEEKEIALLPVQPLDRDTIAAYNLLRDVYGKPSVLLKVDMPRTVYRQGEKSLRISFLFLLVASVVFGLTTILLLERIVLARLAELNRSVKKIALSGDPFLRVNLKGNDELGSLAQEINSMLTTLALSQREQAESQERYQKVVEQASEGIFLIDAQTKKIIEANSAFCDLLGYTPEQVLNLNVYDVKNYDPEEIDHDLQTIAASRNGSLRTRIYKRADGSLIDVEVNINVIAVDGQEVFCLVVRDISERQAALRQRQQMEDALRQSEASFRGMVEQASVGIAFHSLERGDTILVNQKYCDILGYSQDELMELNFREITHPDDIDMAVTQGDRLRRGEIESFTIQKRYLKKDGSIVWGDLTVSLVRDGEGNPQNTIAILADITSRKRAEQALRESEVLLRAIIDQAAVGIAYSALDGVSLLANRKMCEIHGYSMEDLSDLTYRDYTHPEDLEKDAAGMQQLLTGEASIFTIEKRYIHKRGHIVWVNLNVSLVRDEAGEPRYTVVIAQDITDRKRMEAELEESQIRLRATFEQAAVGIAYEKFGNKSLLCNQKYCEILGYSQEELLTVDYRQRTHPEDLTIDEEYTRQLLAGEIDSFSIEKRYIRKDKSVVWTNLSLSLARNEQGEPDYAIIVIQDISDRKAVEIELQQSQAYLKATFDQAAVGVVLTDGSGNILTCNQKYADLLGYSVEELKNLNFQAVTYREDLWIEEPLYAQMIGGGIPTYSIEKRYLHKEGQIIWANMSISLARDAAGVPQYSIGIVEDIRDRKRIEQELRESKARLQLTFEQAAVGIAQGGLNTEQVLLNQKYCDIVGYTAEELMQLSYLDITHPEDRETDVDLTRQLVAGEIDTFSIEKRYIHKQGHEVWVNLTVSLIRDEEGNPQYNIAVVQDISDRKKFEQQVKESEERFRAIASATPIPVFISELPSGKIVYINEAIEPMLGMTHDELIGNTTEQFYLNKSDRAHVLQKLQEQGYIHNYELQIRTKAGQGIWVITSSRVLSFNNKPAVLSVLYDITERKWAEEAIRQAEEKYRSIFENATDGIYQTDLSGEIFNANPALAKIFGYDLAPEMIYEFTYGEAQIYLDQHRRQEFLTLMQTEGMVLKFESQVLRRDGQVIWVSENAHTVYDGAGNPQFYEGMIVDITERKWAETQVNVLQSIILKISELESVESALEVVLREICQLKDWEYGEAWLPDLNNGILYCSQANYMSSSHDLTAFRRASEELTFAKESGLPGRVWQSQAHEWQQDVSLLSAEQFKRHEFVQGYHLGALGVPIMASRGYQDESEQNEVLAVLVCFIVDAGEEDQRLVQLVLAIAAQLGTVIARKQAEAALREAEERYRSIFENASEGIFQSTPGGTYLSVNPALARIYGYESPEDLIDSIEAIDREIYVDPQRRQEFIEIMARYNKVSRFESQVYRQDRTTIWISENARAVRNDRGHVLYYEGTVVDITSRKIAEERLRYEQEQSERLLLNILPSSIAQRLKMQEDTIADYFPDVTVLFADLVGFTEIAAQTEAVELVKLLNGIFSTFDALTEYHQLEKIKTIGDAYMIVSGLPQHRLDHAEAMANMALDMLLAVREYNLAHNARLSMRIGINTGAVVAGVIGTKKFIYDLWGDTVNTASRMESQGLPGCIQVTSQTYEVLKDKYNFEYRGTIHIKGKGEMPTYFLLGARASVLI